MKCNICSSKSDYLFSGKLLNKYDVAYYHCSKCGFIQTESPFWLDEAYSSSINISDTGYMVRNLYHSKRLTVLLYFLFGSRGTFLDYAGGYGVFVRMMRDIGFDFRWDDKFSKNLFALGFEWDKKSKVDAITLFEVFEHFVNPIDELKNLLNISDTIILSTELHPEPIPQPEDWWYYGLDHGQHISFYSTTSFEFIAEKFNLNYYSLGSLHLLTRKNISKKTLWAVKFSKVGFNRIVSKLLQPKTWSDYELISKAGSK